MVIGIALLSLASIIVVIIYCTSDHIDQDILQALRGDREQAKRLLKQAKLRYPGKSERWYIEKVLYDLGRDRGVVKSRSRGIKLNKRDFNWENFFLFSMILSLVQFNWLN